MAQLRKRDWLLILSQKQWAPTAAQRPGWLSVILARELGASQLGRNPENQTVKSHGLSGLTFLPMSQQGSQAVTAVMAMAAMFIPTRYPGALWTATGFDTFQLFLATLKMSSQPSPGHFLWLASIPYVQVPCSGRVWVPLEQASPSATPRTEAFLPRSCLAFSHRWVHSRLPSSEQRMEWVTL